jgi:hypothetical protein
MRYNLATVPVLQVLRMKDFDAFDMQHLTMCSIGHTRTVSIDVVRRLYGYDLIYGISHL